MSMKEAIGVIVSLAQSGVIKNYAITGAVAALAYVEPVSTQDLDILVSVGDFETHTQRSDVGIVVEGWPVQFIPVASTLDEESLREAAETKIGPALTARVLKAEHIVAKAIAIGRLKDMARAEAFLTVGAVDLVALKAVIERHDLEDAWRTFCLKAGRADVLGLGSTS